jgi:hypothetical protein
LEKIYKKNTLPKIYQFGFVITHDQIGNETDIAGTFGSDGESTKNFVSWSLKSQALAFFPTKKRAILQKVANPVVFEHF